MQGFAVIWGELLAKFLDLFHWLLELICIDTFCQSDPWSADCSLWDAAQLQQGLRQYSLSDVPHQGHPLGSKGLTSLSWGSLVFDVLLSPCSAVYPAPAPWNNLGKGSIPKMPHAQCCTQQPGSWLCQDAQLGFSMGSERLVAWFHSVYPHLFPAQPGMLDGLWGSTSGSRRNSRREGVEDQPVPWPAPTMPHRFVSKH